MALGEKRHVQFTDDYPPALGAYADDHRAAVGMRDQVQPGPMNVAGARQLDAFAADEPLAELHRLIRAARDLLGVAPAAPLEWAAESVRAAANQVAAELIRTRDQLYGRDALVDAQVQTIDRCRVAIDDARGLAARLEEQIAVGWPSYYAAQLERTIQDVLEAITTDGPAVVVPQPEGVAAAFDRLVTGARDRAHAEIAAAAKAGAGRVPPPGDVTDRRDTAAQQIVAASPAFRMNVGSQGLPVFTDPDVEPGIIEIRDRGEQPGVGRLLARIVVTPNAPADPPPPPT